MTNGARTLARREFGNYFSLVFMQSCHDRRTEVVRLELEERDAQLIQGTPLAKNLVTQSGK